MHEQKKMSMFLSFGYNPHVIYGLSHFDCRYLKKRKDFISFLSYSV
ncbi:hypothetical protein HMPREF3033_01037 [Veillonellaceae bacterium DNF00751]|nr:hypothetical protein HMPREF3033_01037 [Veillonellaceae bacterium DNF00751]